MENAVIDVIMQRATVRSFQDKDVPDEVIWKLARAAQQAPFTGQMYAFIYTRDAEKKETLAAHLGRFIKDAPVFVLFCVDFRKLEKFIAAKGRQNAAGDLQMLFLGIQDVAYAAMNWVLAAESVGLGTCFFGGAPMIAPLLKEMFNLPERVYPVVGMAMGYPKEKPQPRPRIPTSCVLFKDSYKDLTQEDVDKALAVMDAGLLREGYYQKLNAKIPKPEGGQDDMGYDKYGWGEHISRKYAGRAFSVKLRENLREQGIDV